jgi:hypothetical protein
VLNSTFNFFDENPSVSRQRKNGMFHWKNITFLTILTAYFYTCMEWLFFVTMPSFMSSMTFLNKAGIWFVSGGILAIATLIPILILGLFSLFFPHSLFAKVLVSITYFTPGFLLGAVFLLLIDNFTYTIFHFGIVTSSGIWRGVYALLFLVLLSLSLRWVFRMITRLNRRQSSSKWLLLPISLLTISLVYGFIQYDPSLARQAYSGVSSGKRPNILLIGSDGLDAANMSLYGYARDTTPFLREMASSSLVAENAFSNFAESEESVSSILTGRLPPEKKAENIDIFTGVSAYQHLPGILRNDGYYTIQLGVPQYVDANVVNLQDAFDLINQTPGTWSPVNELERKLGLSDASYFLSRLFTRISDRILHIFYIREMVNPYQSVTQSGEQVNLNDQQKVQATLSYLMNADTPIFIQVHLMGTHGPRFSPTRQLFSTGETQDLTWMTDFYDDSILSFDDYIRQIYDRLAQAGLLDNTMIIIYTDHNLGWLSDQHIPLLFHFPGNRPTGQIQANVQNIDIAPTILGFLGISQPSWMTGVSLLNGEPPIDRLLITQNNTLFVQIVQCDRWYLFYRENPGWFTGVMNGSSATCGGTVSSLEDIPPDIRSYLASQQINPGDRPLDRALFVYNSIVISRSQLAVFLLQRQNGFAYTPPKAEGIFSDVPVDSPLAPWIEQLYRLGVMDSCKSLPLSFCPDELVTRAEVAVILLKMVNGNNYIPPIAHGIFADVPISSPYAPWIEDFYARKYTAGCSKNPFLFCPDDALSSQNLDVFLNKVFVQP